MFKIPPSWTARILSEIRRSGYKPLRDKALARRLDIPAIEFTEFRDLIRDLAIKGKVEVTPRGTIVVPGSPYSFSKSSKESASSHPESDREPTSNERPDHQPSDREKRSDENEGETRRSKKVHLPERSKDAEAEEVSLPTPAASKRRIKESPVRAKGDFIGTFRRSVAGACWVRPEPLDGVQLPDVRIFEEDCLDAAGGDRVLVRRLVRDARVDRKGRRAPPQRARVVRIVERSRSTFVGTYFESSTGGKGFVRGDGKALLRSIEVADASTRHPRPGDKVVIEIVKFPSATERGEGVITEVLGKWGDPGVDLLSVIRAHGLPDHFPDDALEEARKAAAAFDETSLDGREDFTSTFTITIDPVDAKDFDDAISVARRPLGGFDIAVHIADVGHFAPVGGPLDLEARRRGTSVYLPGMVIPMFPEVISNHLASLQEGKIRYVQSVLFSINSQGKVIQSRLARGVIRVAKRLTYEQAQEIIEPVEAAGQAPTERERSAEEAMVDETVKLAREAAGLLNRQRLRRGALELELAEAHLDLDANGKVTSAHWRSHDWSHRLIEELMLAANEAVAGKLEDLNITYLHRVHPAPDPEKLKAFGRFVKSLGYKTGPNPDRRDLQNLLETSRRAPERYAIHFSLLRSLKQAVYTAKADEHFALATDQYCHFTSPIRRYPDLSTHRLVDRLVRTGSARTDEGELEAIGMHCSRMERRAEQAERELTKTRLLDWIAGQLGMEFSARIAGVADYGFFAQGETIPVEGLVHVRSLGFGRYHLDEETQTLAGPGRSFRLGDTVVVRVAHVEPMKGQLDLEVVSRGVRSQATPRFVVEGSPTTNGSAPAMG